MRCRQDPFMELRGDKIYGAENKVVAVVVVKAASCVGFFIQVFTLWKRCPFYIVSSTFSLFDLPRPR